MILCGFLLCLWLLQRRGRRMGVDPTALFDIAVMMLLGGVIGARLLYVVHYWSSYAAQPWRVLFLHEGGLSFFGGLAGGMACLLWGAARRRLPLRAVLDLGASLLPLGHAMGRIGCFLNGCCYGKITRSWIGLRFPRVLAPDGAIIGSPVFRDHLRRGLVAKDALWSQPVHPTQLYAVAYNLVIFAILSYLLPRRHRPGQIAWLYLILYGAARFSNEFLRVTAPQPALGGLTLYQALALAGMAFGLVMSLDTMRKPRVPLPEPWEERDES